MRVTVNIPDPVGRAAEDAAKVEGVSVSALYAQAVERYLREWRRRQALDRIGALIGTTPVPAEAEAEVARDRKGADREIG